MTDKKIGFALGGGGARGIAHIGAIKALKKQGIEADYLAGSSMGAIVASLLAIDYDWEKVEKEALSYGKRKALKELFDVGKVGKSVIRGEKVKAYLHKFIGDAEFKDTKIPLRINATDLGTGKELVIKEGKIIDAIMASICVPGIFPPIKINEKILIDGSIINPTPVDIVKKMGAEAVIAIDLISSKKEKLEKIPNMVNTLLFAFEIIRNQAIEQKIGEHDDNTVFIMPKIRTLIDSFKFYDIEKFIKSGEKAIEEKMGEIEKLIKN